MGPSPALLLALGVIWTRLPLAAAQSPYSKPSISLSPSGEIAPGTDVSISCRGPRQGMRFKVYRAGVARWHTEPAGLTAEFHIPNVRREDGGTYTCSYESLGEPPVSSPRSDPVELVVAVHFSKPSISLSPSGEIAPGTDVSISCRGPRQGMRFKVYRGGVARWHTEPAGLTAEFHIPNVRREDGGTYTCSYESLGEPPVISPPSDPVELVVAGAGSGPTGGSDLTQPGAAPAPTRPGSTRPGAPPRQDYTPFAIVRLSLAVGVLLALVLVLAEAAYSWKRTPHPLTAPQPSREQSRQPEGQTETLVLDLQPPQIPARSLGTGTAGHAHQGGRVGAIGPTGPSSLVSAPHSPPPPPPLPPQIRSMGPSTLVSPPHSPPPPPPPQIRSMGPSTPVSPPHSPPPSPPPQIRSMGPSTLVSPPHSPPPSPPPQIRSMGASTLVSPPHSPPPPLPPEIRSIGPSTPVSPRHSPPPSLPPQIRSMSPSTPVSRPNSPPPSLPL
ncbi:osteoclast-associated immunoglobulin-like receptor isoform X2 [Chelonia mydas]|uniref:osteoclast-associated immunoglobulin-like receptor isoform X2 n=1 Tax=Chelonia mydas TaxID=8469 RepID=UPI001CA82DD9|nr:osteoclast-associated immunoglobulin-like receptor isoform X2 [Chelonia mydas]